jgi:hypothetical protein
MIDPRKLQYFTMAQRLRGFAEGLEGDSRKYESLIGMLLRAAVLLEEAWEEYAVENGYAEIRESLHVKERK